MGDTNMESFRQNKDNISLLNTVVPKPFYNVPREYIYGGIASITNVIIVFPLQKTIFFQQLDGISWIKAVTKLHNEGMRHIYRGVLPPLLQRGTSASLMFGVQSQSERFLFDRFNFVNNNTYASTVVSAAMAGCLEASLTPFERVQTLLQNSKFMFVYKSTPDAISKLVTIYGAPELFRGYSAILIRNCLGNVLYFCGSKFLRKEAKLKDCSVLEKRVSDLFIGCILGAVIGSILFPLNVAKARMQSSVGCSFIGPYKCFKYLLNEGENLKILRLYSGLPANIFRSMLSWGIITMTYQWLIEI